MKTRFTVLGQPATKGSTVSFQGEHGIVTRSDCKTLKQWTQVVGWTARAAGMQRVPAGRPVTIVAIFQFVQPKSAKRRLRPIVKPDVDKLARALLDALTGVAYDDDAQVVNLTLMKIYGPDALTDVTVTDEV